MNNVDMQTLIKIAFGCVILFLFSPLIFSIFGIIAKVILWVIIAIVLIITLSVMYFKHKVKKSESEFYSFTGGAKEQQSPHNSTTSYEEPEEDFNTVNVVDVEFKEADVEDENN